MKELKFVLWICAVGCLLGFVGAVLPWNAILTMFVWLGIETPATQPIVGYALRMLCIITGLIGIFFLILARDPLKYGPMLTLATYGLLFAGLSCLFVGLRYELPVVVLSLDAGFCIVTGTLLLIFRHKALQPAAA